MFGNQHAARSIYFGLGGAGEEEACETAARGASVHPVGIHPRLLLPLLTRLDVETMIKAARYHNDAAQILPEFRRDRNPILGIKSV